MASALDRAFTFYFVRHGVTEQNFRGLRCGGDLDVPLTDIGCDQAYLLAKQIHRMNLDIGVIISGTLMRARQTAFIISGVVGGIAVEIDELLNERRLGEWNNRPIADTERLLVSKVTPPGGESEAEFSARVGRALENLARQLERRPLVVSSTGVARIANNLLGGAGRLQVANGEVVEFSAVRAEDGTRRLRVHRPHQI